MSADDLNIAPVRVKYAGNQVADLSTRARSRTAQHSDSATNYPLTGRLPVLIQNEGARGRQDRDSASDVVTSPARLGPAPPRLRKAGAGLMIVAVTLVAAWIIFISIYDVTPRTMDPGTTACVYWPTNYAERQHIIGIVTKILAPITFVTAAAATTLAMKFRPGALILAIGIVTMVASGLYVVGSLIPDDPGDKLRQCPSSYLDRAGNPA